jgi:hypothetical protein
MKGDRIMTAVDVIVPACRPRFWQKLVVDRLQAAGHDVAVRLERASPWPAPAVHLLQMERRLFRRDGPGLATPVEFIPEVERSRGPNLRLDLSGRAPPSSVPTVRLAFDGENSDFAVAAAVANGRVPDILAVLDDGTVVGEAAPMADKRESTALSAEDVLARAVTLAVSVVGRFPQGWAGRTGRHPVAGRTGAGRFLAAYAGSAAPRLAREAWRRLRYRHAHWRVGYRFVDGPGVAETGVLGTGWHVVPDDGSHFYADPFPFEWQGAHFIFVEDYPHETGKAIISVARIAADGTVAGPVEPVLEEPFHLSYPQVFSWQGEIWMLPESSAGRRLTLYRAGRFPDRWIAETVLLEGEISDATLLQHGGSWWLFATNRDGHGSTSDTMVVFHAPSLTAPWSPHPLNPVVIDRARARPGGAFVEVAGRLMLPVQDGTDCYGGGLGLADLHELNERTVRFGPRRTISAEGDWPYPRIHTLNRVGRLEVIDGIAAVRRR